MKTNCVKRCHRETLMLRSDLTKQRYPVQLTGRLVSSVTAHLSLKEGTGLAGGGTGGAGGAGGAGEAGGGGGR